MFKTNWGGVFPTYLRFLSITPYDPAAPRMQHPANTICRSESSGMVSSLKSPTDEADKWV